MKTYNNNFKDLIFVPAYIMFGSSFSNPIFTGVLKDKIDLPNGLYQDYDLQDENGKLQNDEKFFFVQNDFVFRSLGSVQVFKSSFTEKSIKSAITKLKNNINV